MEEMTLEQWVKNYKIQIKYFASYDHLGNISLVFGSEQTDLIDDNTIEIDKDLAMSIINGEKNIFSYKIDILNRKIYEIKKEQISIKQSLYRIGQDKWSKIVDPDIFIFCNINENSLTFKLSSTFTHLQNTNSCNLLFYITDYNDPDVLRSTVNIDFLKLVDRELVFDNIDLSGNFSIFTKPLFKYTLTLI